MTPPDAALDPLAVHRYRARFRLRRSLEIPADRLGVTLRGAFGLTLRRLVCHDLSLACAACPLRGRCAYPAVFDPGARDDRPAIARLADPPRPFVLRPSSLSADGAADGAELALDLHVVGRAHAQAPVLLAALQRIGDEGLGPRRTPMRLDGVEALNARGVLHGPAVDPGAGRLSASAPALRARDLMRPGDDAAKAARVQYRTPTLLRDRGETLRAPGFGALIRRLRARAGALATVFGDGPLGDDPRAIGAAADAVRIVDGRVVWREGMRRSTRTGQRHPLAGCVGEALYEGELGQFLPLLRLAELLHVGKHATFGFGRIEVEVVG